MKSELVSCKWFQMTHNLTPFVRQYYCPFSFYISPEETRGGKVKERYKRWHIVIHRKQNKNKYSVLISNK